jgi:hypothetical protein
MNETNQPGKFCSNCGTPLAFDAVFCSNCGAQQGAAPAAPKAPKKPLNPALILTVVIIAGLVLGAVLKGIPTAVDSDSGSDDKPQTTNAPLETEKPATTTKKELQPGDKDNYAELIYNAGARFAKKCNDNGLTFTNNVAGRYIYGGPIGNPKALSNINAFDYDSIGSYYAAEMDNATGYIIVKVDDKGSPTQVYWAESKNSKIMGGYPYSAYDAKQDLGYEYLTDFDVLWKD